MTSPSRPAGTHFSGRFNQFIGSGDGASAVGRLLLGIAFVGWLLWICSPYLFMGRLGYVRANELGDAVYPQAAYVARMLRAGQFSLWFPAQAGGTDLLGNLNSPYFNVLLFALLPPWLAHNLIGSLVIVVAGLSTFVLLRRSFHCSLVLSAMGGCIYTSWFIVDFGGVVFGYAAGLAYALAPLILDRLLQAGRLTLKGAAVSTVLGVVFATGGHYTWSIFVLGVEFLCVVLLAPRLVMWWLPHLGIISFATGLLQLPAFLANVETASISARAVEPYYNGHKLVPLILSYFGENPPVTTYLELAIGSTLCIGLAVVLSSGRWSALGRAWPALVFALLFALLPVLDVVVLYTLSVLKLGGFTLQADGTFGGPFDFRLRHCRVFIASVYTALSVEFFWREVLSKVVDRAWSLGWRDHFGRWGGHLGRWRDYLGRGRGPLSLRDLDHRKIATGLVSIISRIGHWLRERGLRRLVMSDLRRLGEVGLCIAVLGSVLGYTYYLLAFTASKVTSMRHMAADGTNFAAYYLHPQLIELSSQNTDFESYRVATVMLLGTDTMGQEGGPCCDPREASLFGGFQTAYRFEIADAYMGNLTRRSVNFWDLAITGHPGFPRADFDSAYRRRFLLPQSAFTQKLYLFQPIGTGRADEDGCIRQTKPIEFAANYNLDMLSLDNVKYIVSWAPLSDSRLTLLESGLRDELMALQCASEAKRFEAFDTKGLVGRPLFIYRNNEVVPRVFAPQLLEVATDERAVYQALMNRSAAQLQRTALVTKADLPANLSHGDSDLQVNIEKLSVLNGDHLQIETSSSTGGVLIVSDSFSPYWRAESVGKSLPVFPAYHTFIGISVPSGRHVINLRYRPPYARFLGYERSS